MSREKQHKKGKEEAKTLLHYLFTTVSKDLSPGKLRQSRGEQDLNTDSALCKWSEGTSVPSTATPKKEQRKQEFHSTRINYALERAIHIQSKPVPRRKLEKGPRESTGKTTSWSRASLGDRQGVTHDLAWLSVHLGCHSEQTTGTSYHPHLRQSPISSKYRRR